MKTIRRVHAREVLDSRGHPTVEVEVHLSLGDFARAIVPSGASTGQAEAYELRDGDPEWYDGRGVRKAVDNVNNVLGPAVVGIDVVEQTQLDQRLIDVDGTANKSRLGANAILGVSLAAAHAAAIDRDVPLYVHLNDLLNQTEEDEEAFIQPRLPMPMTNMISGGLHAGSNIDFQDFLAIPHAAPSYAVALEWLARIYNRLGKLLAESGFEGRLVGDEGGFGPRLPSNDAAASFVVRAIEAAGLRPGGDVSLAIDVASTHFWKAGQYQLAATGEGQLSTDAMIEFLAGWCDRFPIRTLEDGLAEEDWAGWQKLTERLGDRVTLIGDDLFATDPQRVARGLHLGAGNAVLVKLNQIGTLTETLETIRVARAGGFQTIVSARSGETEDDTIADLAVAVAADYIKIGSIARSERLAKYNRLLRISEQVQSWAGR